MDDAVEGGVDWTFADGYPEAGAMEKFATSKGIDHRAIKPGTPEHNGKVERSRRTDQDRFYRGLSFYSRGPEEPGRGLDEAVQRHPEEGARPKVAERGGT